MKEKTYPWVDAFFNNLKSPREKEIAERLKGRFAEMEPVYDEIERKMRPVQNIEKSDSAENVLWAVINGAVFFNEKSAREHRQRMKVLKEIYGDIIKASKKLCKLMDRLEEMQDQGGTIYPEYIPFQMDYLIKRAECPDAFYEEWTEWDDSAWQVLKFNYNLRDILKILISDMSDINFPVSGPVAAALSSQKASSRSDFLRYFLVALNEYVVLHDGKERKIKQKDLPLTAKSICTIAECCLALPSGCISTAEVSQAKAKCDLQPLREIARELNSLKAKMKAEK